MAEVVRSHTKLHTSDSWLFNNELAHAAVTVTLQLADGGGTVGVNPSDGTVRNRKKQTVIFPWWVFFFDFVERSGTTRAEDQHGAHVRGAKRKRIDRHSQVSLPHLCRRCLPPTTPWKPSGIAR